MKVFSIFGFGSSVVAAGAPRKFPIAWLLLGVALLVIAGLMAIIFSRGEETTSFSPQRGVAKEVGQQAAAPKAAVEEPPKGIVKQPLSLNFRIGEINAGDLPANVKDWAGSWKKTIEIDGKKVTIERVGPRSPQILIWIKNSRLFLLQPEGEAYTVFSLDITVTFPNGQVQEKSGKYAEYALFPGKTGFYADISPWRDAETVKLRPW